MVIHGLGDKAVIETIGKLLFTIGCLGGFTLLYLMLKPEKKRWDDEDDTP